MRPEDTQCSPRSISYASVTGTAQGVHSAAAVDALADDDAIHASTATAVGNTAYAAGDLLLSAFDPPRYVSITTTTSAGTYRTGASYPIVFTGTYGGEVVTSSLLLTQANGNETIRGNQPFDTITAITIPGQVNTSGAIKIGVSGVACPKRLGRLQPFRAFMALGTGNVKLGFDSGYSDLCPVTAGEQNTVLVTRVYGDATYTTASGIKLFI